MFGNQVGRRTVEKAKIICPPPSGVGIIKDTYPGETKLSQNKLCILKNKMARCGYPIISKCCVDHCRGCRHVTYTFCYILSRWPSPY